MSAFAPIVPLGGLTGLRFVERSYEAQLERFSRAPDLERDISAFLERAGSIGSAADLVQDPPVLRVVLGAFGLEDEAPKRAFVRKVLEEGTIDPRAFANRLNDPAWKNLTATVNLGPGGAGLDLASVREAVAERYRVRQFEKAVGESDVNIRLALNFRREIGEIATSAEADRSGWFRIMGSRPLRTVVEGAFGLPSSFAQIDIDLQRGALEDASRSRYGAAGASVFADPENVEDAIRRFLLRAQIESGPQPGTRGMAALSILQARSLGPGAQAGLFASNLTGIGVQ